MIDHLGINWCRPRRLSAAFYDKVLATLGFSRIMDFEVAMGYGADKPDFWIGRQPDEGPAAGPNREIHVAFQAADPAAVRAFFEGRRRAGRPRCCTSRGSGRSTTTRYYGSVRARPRRQQRRGGLPHRRARETDSLQTGGVAGPATQRGHVVGRGVGGRGGVGEHAEVRRRRQAAFVRVEDVGPHDQPPVIVETRTLVLR